MTKQKFNVLITRTDEYEVEIDKSLWTEAALKDWSAVFNKADKLEDLAEIIASRICKRDSNNDNHEGFGYIKLTTVPTAMFSMRQSDEIKYNEGISVKIISEGEEEFETEIV